MAIQVDQLVQDWIDAGKPRVQMLPKSEDASVITDVEKFIAAGPGPLPQHEAKFNQMLDAIRRTIEERQS